jgi:hypothetical protein
VVADAIKHWLKQRVRRDVRETAEKYVRRIGRKPRSIRVAEFKMGWGSCGANGTVNLDWRLIFAPKRVLEYVVVHELAHLKYRSHGNKFWEYLGDVLPTYVGAKAWLEAHQAVLDGDFLKSSSKNVKRLQAVEMLEATTGAVTAATRDSRQRSRTKNQIDAAGNVPLRGSRPLRGK